ncbi:MAG: glycosyltransferase [Bacteroidales bacterium]|nr:glycosyltransferase [Bacteroidales bacterium]
MLIVYIISLIIACAYIVLLYALIRGWNKLKNTGKDSKNPFSVFISLIVSARNEEKYINGFLESIAKQSYPQNLFELIIIDDASEDKTAEIIQSFCQRYDHFKSISFKNHKGKKTAVDFAVKNAKGNLIVQTDADCIQQSTWLEEIAKKYQQKPAQMILAPVLMNYSSGFEAMQALDFLSLMASGMAAAGFNKPIMNNAANLIFEKTAYLNLKNPNFKQVSSGDDVFFLLNLKKNKGKIAVLKSLPATVYTKPEKTLKSFIRQRKRWTSKSRYYRDKDIIFTALSVFLINFAMLISLITSFSIPKVFFVFLLIFFIKSIFDFIFLYRISHFFRQKKLLKYFVPVQILNIFFVPYIVFTGLSVSVQWK